MSNTIISPKIIGLKELRLNIEKYIKMIKKGHSFIVMKKSEPVFKLEPTDKWGDDGTWESVANFTKMDGGGIPLGDLLGKLKSI